MPIFDYHCKCGYEKESLANYNDLIYCDRCQDLMAKKPTYANFVLQGSGWSSRGSITSLDGWKVRKKHYKTGYDAKHDINGIVTEGIEK